MDVGSVVGRVVARADKAVKEAHPSEEAWIRSALAGGESGSRCLGRAVGLADGEVDEPAGHANAPGDAAQGQRGEDTVCFGCPNECVQGAEAILAAADSARR